MDLRSDLKQTLRFEMFQFIFVFSTLFVCDIVSRSQFESELN